MNVSKGHDPDRPYRWILVAGAFEKLTKEQERAATAVGRMLGRAGYGLIVGCWSGVDYLVTRSFRDVVGPQYANRLRQIDTSGGPEGEPKPGKVTPHLLDPSDPDGSHLYSEEAVCLADAGVVVPGCIYSKPGMDALIRKDKPVLPVAYLGSDAFEVFVEMLEDWQNLPIRTRLTRRQFLELAMPSTDCASLARLLFAALQEEPVLFVSYRHADVPDAAARITELLVHRYGLRSVFIDVEGLAPGRVFSTELERAVRGSRAVVPIIGPRWEGPLDDNGVARISQPDDWVAKELLIAFEEETSVLPVLVQRAALDFTVIPQSLRALEPIQRTQARYEDMEHDLQRLFDALDRIVLPSQGAPR